MSGCNLLNTRDISAIRSFFKYFSKFIVEGGVIIMRGGSDFSGCTASKNEWINHDYDKLIEFVDRHEFFVEGPYVCKPRLIPFVELIESNRVIAALTRLLKGKLKWTILHFVRERPSQDANILPAK